MNEIAYFIPFGQHDPKSVLGEGWGPRTVYTDGTFDMGDKRLENKAEHLQEQIDDLRLKVETLMEAKP